jgi:hypothetical protein
MYALRDILAQAQAAGAAIGHFKAADLVLLGKPTPAPPASAYRTTFSRLPEIPCADQIPVTAAARLRGRSPVHAERAGRRGLHPERTTPTGAP